MGRNGSGKTTLMRLLAGVEQPDHGARRAVRPARASRCCRRTCRPKSPARCAASWPAGISHGAGAARNRVGRGPARRSHARATCSSTATADFASLSTGMKRRVLLAQAHRGRARRAAARRADEPSRHRVDRVARRFSVAVEEHAAVRHARPGVSHQAGAPHPGDRSREAVRLVVRLPDVSGAQGRGAGGRGEAERAVRQEAGPGGGVDSPGHQGPPHAQRRPRAGAGGDAPRPAAAPRRGRQRAAGNRRRRAERGAGAAGRGRLVRLRRPSRSSAT